MFDGNSAPIIDAVAIIGASGQFPDSKTLEQLWKNLAKKKELIRFFSSEELKKEGIEEKKLNDKNYIKAKGYIEDAAYFDADFFNYNPREAELIDPQQRLFLEWAWQALESAGYDPEQYDGLIGVFASSSISSYFYYHLSSLLFHNSESFQEEMLMAMGNEKDFLATRVSYKLNLKGPSKTIQTACSSSLVAVHDACQSLLNFECDMALAGGISVTFPLKCGYHYLKEGIQSSDGHCRAFDHRASGTLIGNGGGIVVLKRLSDALNDKDNILAVIKGSAINNDGGNKAGFTAPSIDGQARVITAAHLAAGISADSISYLEAHGTGTALGDPIEIAALTSAFRLTTNNTQFCAIGSVKTNMGHLDAAAGIAGLIKTILCLHHRQIPAHLHFEKPNPKISFENSPFYINSELKTWQNSKYPLRAGVSSFGIGGTNAHVILEEPPSSSKAPCLCTIHAFPFSAKTSSALKTLLSNFLEILPNIEENLADIAYTLQVGRKAFEKKIVFIASKKEELMQDINTYLLTEVQPPLPDSLPIGMLEKIEAWRVGKKVNWQELYTLDKRWRVALPTYPFERKRYLVQPQSIVGLSPTVQSNSSCSSEEKLEHLICSIWQDRLKIKTLNCDDDFFALGGDSLLALEIAEVLRQKLYIDINLQHLFQYTTVNTLAVALKEEIYKKIPELSDEEAAALLEII